LLEAGDAAHSGVEHAGNVGTRLRGAGAEAAPKHDDPALGRRQSRQARGTLPNDPLELLLSEA
jgi:hypothetical protein